MPTPEFVLPEHVLKVIERNNPQETFKPRMKVVRTPVAPRGSMTSFDTDPSEAADPDSQGASTHTAALRGPDHNPAPPRRSGSAMKAPRVTRTPLQALVPVQRGPMPGCTPVAASGTKPSQRRSASARPADSSGRKGVPNTVSYANWAAAVEATAARTPSRPIPTRRLDL